MTYSHIDNVFLLSDENQKSKLILWFMIIFMDWESQNEATSRVYNISMLTLRYVFFKVSTQ